jgi:hypothetical protein
LTLNDFASDDHGYGGQPSILRQQSPILVMSCVQRGWTDPLSDLHCWRNAGNDPDVFLIDPVGSLEVECLTADDDDNVDDREPREPYSFSILWVSNPKYFGLVGRILQSVSTN